jgi:hypothetical protein
VLLFPPPAHDARKVFRGVDGVRVRRGSAQCFLVLVPLHSDVRVLSVSLAPWRPQRAYKVQLRQERRTELADNALLRAAPESDAVTAPVEEEPPRSPSPPPPAEELAPPEPAVEEVPPSPEPEPELPTQPLLAAEASEPDAAEEPIPEEQAEPAAIETETEQPVVEQSEPESPRTAAAAEAAAALYARLAGSFVQ